MERPVRTELRQHYKIVEWANSPDIPATINLISKYNNPVYIVGSGGSFSTWVCAADLLTSRGVFTKTVTQLKLFYSNTTIKKSNLIFMSASGSNADIIFAYRKANENEPVSILNICIRRSSKQATLSSGYSSCTTIGFALLAAMDGFPTINSLAAYFVILYHATISSSISKRVPTLQDKVYESFINKTDSKTSLIILFGSDHHAVAVDMESQFPEIGLAAPLLSDYRHFDHGRHSWFAKQSNSAVIDLSCPADEKLSNKTLRLS